MTEKPPETPGQLTLVPPTHHVIVPYDSFQAGEDTIAAVMGWGGSYQCEAIDPNSPLAYPDAMCGWWAMGTDLVIVRQTAEVAPGIIRTLLACPQPWCVRAKQVPGLGPRWSNEIVKISAHLPASHPRLIEHALDYWSERGHTMEWAEWDEHLAYLLGALDHRVHVHYPPAAGPGDSAAGGGGG